MHSPHARIADVRAVALRQSPPVIENRFDFEGPEEFRADVTAALRRVIDPEMGLNIVDVGLVYGVRIDTEGVRVRMTMTSASCPLVDVIVEDVMAEMQDGLPWHPFVKVDLVWEPSWTPERMGARGNTSP